MNMIRSLRNGFLCEVHEVTLVRKTIRKTSRINFSINGSVQAEDEEFDENRSKPIDVKRGYVTTLGVGILRLSAGIGSVCNSSIFGYDRTARHYCTTGVNDSKNEKENIGNELAKNIERTVVEYTENSKPSNRKIDFDSMTKSEVIAYYSNQLGILQTKFEQTANKLWIPTARAAINRFEDRHGKDADLDYASIPKKITYRERTMRVREMRFNWIFANKAQETEVSRLIDKIGQSEVESTSQFSKWISEAYWELSDDMKSTLLSNATGTFEFESLTTNTDADKALCVFMEMYNFRGIVVKKKSD